MSKLVLLLPAGVSASVHTTLLLEIAGWFCWSCALPVDRRVMVPVAANTLAALTRSSMENTRRPTVLMVCDRLFLWQLYEIAYVYDLICSVMHVCWLTSISAVVLKSRCAYRPRFAGTSRR